MARARLASLGIVLLLGCAPVLGLAACGGADGSGPLGGGDDMAGEDATAALDAGADRGLGPSGDGGADSYKSAAEASGSDDGSGDGTTDDGSTGDDAGGSPDVATVCVPGCPANVTCGRYVDCTGATLTCGQPCAKGQSCVRTGAAQSCQPTAMGCSGLCGIIANDPCGVPISCGGCPAGNDCVANKCVPQTTSDAGPRCGPLACSIGTRDYCGTITDGCGHTKQCSCPAGESCVGGLCEAPPPECADADGGVGSKCGALPNACGSGNVQCGGCTGLATCNKGACTGCTAPSCNGATCGEVSNGCGPKVSCGTCPMGEDCYNGSCCTEKTCAEILDAGGAPSCLPVDVGCGKQRTCAPCGGTEVCESDGGCCQPLTCADVPDAGCDPVDLGCGVKKTCYTCQSSDFCQSNTCVACQPKTCADFGNAGCNHQDGCGHRLDCCPTETACQGSLCCPIGQVNYQGTCCQPTCDPTKPLGPQMSCGQVILCTD
jgi:hypothetical protein